MNKKALEIESIMEKMGREEPAVAMAMADDIFRRIADIETVDGLTFMVRMGERLVFETGASDLPFNGEIGGPQGAIMARADNPSTFVMALVFAAHDAGIKRRDACAMLAQTATKFKELCDGLKGEKK